MAMKKNWLKCSRCGKRFSGLRPGEALNKMRKHLWKFHADWMTRRIKSGQKKARKRGGLYPGDNPAWARALLTGIFPPGNIPGLITQYRGMSPAERATAKRMVTALTVPVGAEASAVAALVMKALDLTVETGVNQ